MHDSDLKLMAAEARNQTAEGGGRRSAVEIYSRRVGDLIDRVSRLDLLAKVKFYKAFGWVDIDTPETAYGAHAILTAPPTEPLLAAHLVYTGSQSDTIADVRDYIEGYLTPSTPAQCYLWLSHPAGLPVVTLWQRLDQALPRANQAFWLYDADAEQGEYIRVRPSEIEERTFVVPQGGGTTTITRRIVSCTLSAPLQHSYTGPDVGTSDPDDANVTLRETRVAGRAFYGIAPLAAAAEIDDATVLAESVYGQLIPAIYGEQVLSGQTALTAGTVTVASGGKDFAIAGPTHQYEIPIAEEDRRYNYTIPMLPVPATGGTPQASAVVLGEWYTIREGESNDLGVLNVSRASGSATLSLSRFPDADTSVLGEWPAGIHYTDRAGTVDINPVRVEGQLPYAAAPGTVEVSWTSGSVPKSATAAITGQIQTADVDGYVSSATGKYWLAFTALPDYNTAIVIDYERISVTQESFGPLTPAAGIVEFTLSDLHEPGTLTLAWEVQQHTELAYGSENPPTVAISYLFCIGECSQSVATEATANPSEWGSSQRRTVKRSTADDGSGNLVGDLGTVNNATGEVALEVLGDYDYATWSEANHAWENASGTETFRGYVTATYALEGATGIAEQETIPAPALAIDLLPSVLDFVVPGTVRLRLNGVAYSDRTGLGTLYLGNGTAAGTFDYLRKTATLTYWSGTSRTLIIDSLVSTFGSFTTSEATFRAAGIPLATGATVYATATDGDVLTATDNGTGTLVGTGITGTVLHDIGLFRVTFSKPVWPGSIRYDAVVITALPLGADKLGLDPTPMPTNGQVPIFLPAMAVVVHQTETEAAPSPLSGNQVIDTGVDKLARLELLDGYGEITEVLPGGLVPDQDVQLLSTVDSAHRLCEYVVLKDAEGKWVSGDLYAVDLETALVTLDHAFSLAGYVEPFQAKLVRLVAPALYTVDLEAGTATMASDVSDLAEYTVPLTLRYRWEDASRIVDVQPNGTIVLQNTLDHAYAAPGAYISGLAEHGDMQAKAVNVFAQGTWTGVWSDDRIGSAPDEDYDTLNYPFVLTGRGAIAGRYCIRFSNSTGAFELIEESRGVLATGTQGSDFAPVNPATAAPYVTIYAAGWGGSYWPSNSCLRFNVEDTAMPVWVMLTVLAGDAQVADDQIGLEMRVDGD